MLLRDLYSKSACVHVAHMFHEETLFDNWQLSFYKPVVDDTWKIHLHVFLDTPQSIVTRTSIAQNRFLRIDMGTVNGYKISQ